MCVESVCGMMSGCGIWDGALVYYDRYAPALISSAFDENEVVDLFGYFVCGFAMSAETRMGCSVGLTGLILWCPCGIAEVPELSSPSLRAQLVLWYYFAITITNVVDL
ncbi:hypothetical protein Nepgr_032596 [Nepenthes gracilis]|uniref:Uncharacterized protein n=1 Tax=Nepenthes gracilis TaxID=150966 RepID=A0AAD3TIX8_NEPGR|nr:hypothetical protein Nepgr_032596 [Nepenthes gracilis]